MNALAALALASSIAKPGRAMHEALARFGGLPHRMAPIADAGGVLYIDDSKGTTVAATQVALDGIGRRVVLIAGGDGKGQSFAPLKASVDRACRAVLLIGRDAGRVAHGLAGTAAQRRDRRHARTRPLRGRWSWRVRGTRSCSRPPARASTSFVITSNAAAASPQLVAAHVAAHVDA